PTDCDHSAPSVTSWKDSVGHGLCPSGRATTERARRRTVLGLRDREPTSGEASEYACFRLRGEIHLPRQRRWRDRPRHRGLDGGSMDVGSSPQYRDSPPLAAIATPP